MTTATAPKRRTRRARPAEEAQVVDATLTIEPAEEVGPALQDTTSITDSTDLFPPAPAAPAVRIKRPLADADGIEGEDDEEDDPDSPYISFIAATKRYDISRQALHKLCVQGKIPFYLRYNNRRRFLRAEADEYLGLTRVEATNPLPKRDARG